jgi:hypothetical protein
MKATISRCRALAPVFVLIVLIALQGIVYSGPCYQSTGGNWGCYSQGGLPCEMYVGARTLDCPGGPWTLSDLSAMGRHSDDPCDAYTIEQVVPKANSTSGNEASGYMSQGYYTFDCSKSMNCTRHRELMPPAIVIISCFTTTAKPCTTHTIFTAGGAPCPGTG